MSPDPSPAAKALDTLDLDGFERALDDLRREIGEPTLDDLRHFQRVERWGRLCTAAGYLTAWLAPNPVSALLLEQGLVVRFLMMHHLGHGAYDRVPGLPRRYHSRVFARGWRRYVDWLDWVVPEGWTYEHVILHHPHTGEDADPDLVERITEFIRTSGWPMALRRAVLLLMGLTWRHLYYGPMTLRELRRRGRDATQPFETFMPRPADFLDLRRPEVRELWRRCLLPNAVVSFALVPALFLPLGAWAVFSVVANTLLADLLTNIHTFMVVTPNHSGDDLYRFPEPPRTRGEFYLRQVLNSADYRCGSAWLDTAQLWLNYQVEHHLWPSLPLSMYRRMQPRVREICERFGVPYVQDSLWRRIRKMLAVGVGEASMRRWGAIPAEPDRGA